ncbi:sulfatase-like hydrolase/transferase [Gayadomonas joobiniege]|uniref:sulfatase-like hydrolase/transferase n=1 Tax=Gayadomonas joobiniege TaxID=1234606 RepID=UPI0003755DE3|nr:sulfatase-like hydrolase/transferase [Gayadomonas joobiniege]
MFSIKRASWFAFLFLLLAPSFLIHARSDQPNIIFILTDDQPYGYLSVTGNPVVKTPNIDELANQGVLFTNAHVTSAICTPSRISILLSQYERKHGVNFNSGTSVAEEAWHNSYPVLLKKAGYYTGWVGKNHAPIGEQGYLSGIMEKSFDYWYAGHGHIRFYPKEAHKIFKEAENDTQIEVVGEGVTDFLDNNEHRFKRAIKFLEKRPTDKPFMLSINLNLPHGAGTSTMEQRESDDKIYKSLFRDIEIPLPKHYLAKADIKQPKLPAWLHHVKDRQTIYNSVDTPAGTRERLIRQYQAMTGIDRMVGKIRQMLAEKQIDDNTVIVFTSDHGLFMGEHGLGGKGLCYEKNTHVPMIIYDPRKRPANNRSDALVSTIDIAPTLLSMAGVSAPDTFQGEDLHPVIYQNKATQRALTFTENLWSTHFGNPRCEAVQDKNWKYIRYYQNNNASAVEKIKIAKHLGMNVNKMLYGVHDPQIATYRSYAEGPLQGEKAVYEELYYIAEDPLEAHNLIDDPKHEAVLNRLKAEWKKSLEYARGSGFPKVNRYTVDIEKGYTSK